MANTDLTAWLLCLISLLVSFSTSNGSVVVFTYRDTYVIGKATYGAYIAGHIIHSTSPFDQFRDPNAVRVELESLHITGVSGDELLTETFTSRRFQFGSSMQKSQLVAEGRQMNHVIGSVDNPEAMLSYHSFITKESVFFEGTEHLRPVKEGSVALGITLSPPPGGRCNKCRPRRHLVVRLAIRSSSGVTAEANPDQKTLHLAGGMNIWFPMKCQVGSDRHDALEVESISFEEENGITYATITLPLGGVEDEVTWRGLIELPDEPSLVSAENGQQEPDDDHQDKTDNLGSDKNQLNPVEKAVDPLVSSVDPTVADLEESTGSITSREESEKDVNVGTQTDRDPSLPADRVTDLPIDHDPNPQTDRAPNFPKDSDQDAQEGSKSELKGVSGGGCTSGLSTALMLSLAVVCMLL